MSASLYPFADGDRLYDRNTYFYTPYGGQSFLAAWKRSRLPVGVTTASVVGLPQVESLNESAGQEMAVWLQAWRDRHPLSAVQSRRFLHRLRHFEVSKRLFAAYGADDKPLDRGDYRSIPRYLDFALVLEAAYAASLDLRFLNALLKISDTLVSMRAVLPSQDVLDWLLHQEQMHVAALAQRVGVSL